MPQPSRRGGSTSGLLEQVAEGIRAVIEQAAAKETGEFGVHTVAYLVGVFFGSIGETVDRRAVPLGPWVG